MDNLPAAARTLGQSVDSKRRFDIIVLPRSIPRPSVAFVGFGFHFQRRHFGAVKGVREVDDSHRRRGPKPPLHYEAITTQSVPLHTNMAHAPAVAARIAVPAVAELAGWTLDDADTTV